MEICNLPVFQDTNIKNGFSKGLSNVLPQANTATENNKTADFKNIFQSFKDKTKIDDSHGKAQKSLPTAKKSVPVNNHNIKSETSSHDIKSAAVDHTKKPVSADENPAKENSNDELTLDDEKLDSPHRTIKNYLESSFIEQMHLLTTYPFYDELKDFASTEDFSSTEDFAVGIDLNNIDQNYMNNLKASIEDLSTISPDYFELPITNIPTHALFISPENDILTENILTYEEGFENSENNNNKIDDNLTQLLSSDEKQNLLNIAIVNNEGFKDSSEHNNKDNILSDSKLTPTTLNSTEDFKTQLNASQNKEQTSNKGNDTLALKSDAENTEKNNLPLKETEETEIISKDSDSLHNPSNANNVSPFASKLSHDVKQFNFEAKVQDLSDATPIDQIRINIEKAVQENKSTISVVLKPEELGRVDISMEITEGKIKSIEISAGTQEALELLQSSVKELQKVLHEVTKSEDTNLSFNLKDGNSNNGYSSDQRESFKYQNYNDKPIKTQMLSFGYMNGYLNMTDQVDGINILV